jgi:hypothetical protein
LPAPLSIDSVLRTSGEQRFAKVLSPLPDRVWRTAVGHAIADRSRPVSLENGVLVVRVAGSVWSQELTLLERNIRAELELHGFRVRELRFRVGQIEPIERPPERRTARQMPPPAPTPIELTRVLASVADTDLRTIIETTARGNLAWQSFVRDPGASPRSPRRG